MIRTAQTLLFLLMLFSYGCIAGPTPFPINDANPGTNMSDMGYLGASDASSAPESCEWDDSSGEYLPEGCEPVDPSSDAVGSDGDAEGDAEADGFAGDLGPDATGSDASTNGDVQEESKAD